MSNSEVCVNLWFCVDKKTGFINALAGRGYVMSGTDEQKTMVLKFLANHDFLCADWLPVPERYRTTLVNVSDDTQSSFAGVIHSSDIDVLGMDLFEDVFKKIESASPLYLPVRLAGNLKIPDEPLYVMTAVLDAGNGKLQAVSA